MSQREATVFKFRDAVAEICGQSPELLEKQHALRVESCASPIRHAVRDEFGAAKGGKTVGAHGLTGRGRKRAAYSPRSAWRIMTRTTCKRGLQVRMRCGVKPVPALPDATIRKFRTVAREGAWRLESLLAQRKTLPASKNKKGES